MREGVREEGRERLGGPGANVIHVDFRAGCRRHDEHGVINRRLLPEPAAAVVSAHDFLVFRRSTAGGRPEYLGGRWNRRWLLFVWTREDAFGDGWHPIVRERGYVAEWLDRGAFRELLVRCAEVVGLIVDGDVDATTRAIRAAPEQMVSRVDALRLLGR